MKTTVLVKLDTRDPDLGRLREVARGVREGKIAAFPTETVYGMGGPMSVSHLAATLSQIKKREDDKPFSYHIGDWDMLAFLGVRRTPVFRFLTRNFWPGPLTVIALNQQGDKIGLRFPRHRLAAALITAVGEPFIATSANLSGAPSPRRAEDVMNALGGQIDYLIDGGPCEIGQDSTVVDATTDPPVILRRGASAEAVDRAVEKIKSGKFPRKRILLVCTGNSCRSPMGAAWLARELRNKGLSGEIEVASCGIGARNGMPSTSEAIIVMKNREIDLSGHRSRACTRQDVWDADLIFTMSEEHSNFIAGMVPEAREKIQLLGIPDPIGMGMFIYEEVMDSLERKLKEKWNDIVE